jgi:hypothetical protein
MERRNRHSHGIQQSLELNFTHRTLPRLGGTVANVFCLRLARIAQILSIRQSKLAWLAESLNSRTAVTHANCEKNHV